MDVSSNDLVAVVAFVVVLSRVTPAKAGIR
jgi:hypothetical protein